MAWKVVTVAVVAVVAVLQLSTVSAAKYDVHWSPGVNLTQWAAKYHFYEGDWLVFHYVKDQFDVLQVNETAYKWCINDHPIVNYTRGPSFAFNLSQPNPYYFICSRGTCWGGMKLAVTVHLHPPPSPPPKSHPSGAPNGPWPFKFSWPTLLLGALWAFLGL